MNNTNKEQRIWLIVTIATVTILIFIFAGLTYAFFTSNDNTGSTAEITNTSGKMTITYSDGNNNLLVSSDISPSNNIIVDKTFTLTGTNTSSAGSGLAMPYQVGIIYKSSFSYGQLKYYIKRLDSNENITSNFIGISNQTIVGHSSETNYISGTFFKNNVDTYLELVTGEFKPNSSQNITFNLKLQFPDTGENQDSEKGKTFTGYIVVNYEENSNAIVTTFDYKTPTENNNEPYYTYTAAKSGTYKLETWGAQGGYGKPNGNRGGFGGYSVGNIKLTTGDKIYIYVGGQGETSPSVTAGIKAQGGYNGGGSGTSTGGKFGSGGGGATHISYQTGLLQTLENNKEQIVIVSGGGGAGFNHSRDDLSTIGGSAGGYKGTGNNPGTQNITVTEFGAGSSYGGGAGGGSGYYGGSYCTDNVRCGGGSSYIASTYLIPNTRYMYCYECEESTNDSIYSINTIGTNPLTDKVICPNGYSTEPTEKCAKAGNGFAKITFIS